MVRSDQGSFCEKRDSFRSSRGARKIDRPSQKKKIGGRNNDRRRSPWCRQSTQKSEEDPRKIQNKRRISKNERQNQETMMIKDILKCKRRVDQTNK